MLQNHNSVMREQEGKKDREEHRGVGEEEGRGIQRKQRTKGF